MPRTTRGRPPNSFKQGRVQWHNVNVMIAHAYFERLNGIANDEQRTLSSVIKDAIALYLESIGSKIDPSLPLPTHIKRSELFKLAEVERWVKRSKGLSGWNEKLAEVKNKIFDKLIRHGWENDPEWSKNEFPNEMIEATIAKLKEMSSWNHALTRISFNAHRTLAYAVLENWQNFHLTPLDRYPKHAWTHTGEYAKPMPEYKAPEVQPQPELIPKVEVPVESIEEINEPTVEKLWTDSHLPTEE